MTFAQRKKVEVFKSIASGSCTLRKLETTAKQISAVACRSKIKYLTLEEAAANIYKYPVGVEPYLCPNGLDHVHFGHVPAWCSRARTIIVKKQQAKKRNPRTKMPKWKLDPRMSSE